MRVIASGVLKSRSYETKEGEKRTVIELEIDEIGPSLRYANAKVNRAQRGNGNQGNNSVQGNGFGSAPNGGYRQQNAGAGNQAPAGEFPPGDPWATPGAPANAGGWGNGPDSEPPF